MRRNAIHRYAVEQMANGAGGFGGNRTMLVNDLCGNRRGEERADDDENQRREHRPSSDQHFHHNVHCIYNI
jgi:hypothetical protein